MSLSGLIRFGKGSTLSCLSPELFPGEVICVEVTRAPRALGEHQAG